MQSLLEMLKYRRPAGSKTEKAFIRRFLTPLGVEADKYGNLIKRIGTAPIMWSSHTDTVHRAGGLQQLTMDDKGRVWTDDKQSNCLGADCTTGVWLMVEMIKAGVEGLYVFHREEEIGGKGSRYIAKNTPELVAGIEACIAFDRFGVSSVITYQSSERCCSDEFANSLATIIDLPLAPDTGGTFTDSASYTDLIPECTNLSVGYYSQHSVREYQDLNYAVGMRDKMVAFKPDGLVIKRKAGEVETLWDDYSRYYSGYGYGSSSGSYLNDEVSKMDRIIRYNSWELAKYFDGLGVTAAELREILFKIDDGEDGDPLPFEEKVVA